MWIYVLGLPVVFSALTSFLLTFVITHETPLYYIQNDKEQECIEVISKVYDTSKIQPKQIYDYLKESTNKETFRVSLGEAFCTNEHYTRASYLGMFLVLAVAANGSILFKAFGNQIFSSILAEDKSIEMTARTAIYLVGFANLLGAAISLWSVNTFGRRTLLLTGHTSIAIIQFTTGIFLLNHEINTAILLCYLFAFTFEVTNALVLWMYVTETCQDVALGMSGMFMFGAVLFEAYTAFTLINELHPSGFFFVYGIFSTLALIFTYNFIAETKGLTDKEKKELYIPGAKWGRALKPGEVYAPKRLTNNVSQVEMGSS